MLFFIYRISIFSIFYVAYFRDNCNQHFRFCLFIYSDIKNYISCSQMKSYSEWLSAMINRVLKLFFATLLYLSREHLAFSSLYFTYSTIHTFPNISFCISFRTLAVSPIVTKSLEKDIKKKNTTEKQTVQKINKKKRKHKYKQGKCYVNSHSPPDGDYWH